MYQLTAKNIKTVLAIILAIALLFIGYVILKRLKGGADALGTIFADSAENAAIGQAAGITAKRVSELRTAAYNIASELETLKGLTWLQKLSQVTNNEDLYLNLGEAQSLEEMKVIKALYKSEFTDYRDLWDDLNSETLFFNPAKVAFVAALY